MSKIKILEIESSKGWGGQEKRTVRLINNLKEDFEVFFAVSKDSELFKRRKEIKAEFFEVEIKNSLDPRAILSLIKIVKKLKIDIICTHSGKDGWIGALVGRLTGRKIVRTRHLLVPIKSPRSYNLSHKVIAISKAVYNYLKNAGVKENKLELIYTGIDVSRFVPKKRKMPSNTFRIGIIAVLRAAKRHTFLLDAIKDLDLEVWIIGDGPQKRNIQKFVRNHKLENKVKLLGFVEKPEDIIPELDVVVLPSEHEALGTALLEAQSCGIPVIGSDVGGIAECVVHGKTGLLFEKDNKEDLRNKILYLKNNPEIRKKMGEEARKFIEQKFSLEVMVEKTEQLYMKLMENKNG